MNPLLARQLQETLGSDSDAYYAGRGNEAQLRVAAATLANAPLDMISATTVVGVLGQDDAQAFEALVADIANEFGLESRIRRHVGSFFVRFSRRETADAQHLGGKEFSR